MGCSPSPQECKCSMADDKDEQKGMGTRPGLGQCCQSWRHPQGSDYSANPFLTRMVVEGNVVPLGGPYSEGGGRDGWIGVGLG